MFEEAQLYFNAEGIAQSIELFVQNPDLVDSLRQPVEDAAQRQVLGTDVRVRRATQPESLGDRGQQGGRHVDVVGALAGGGDGGVGQDHGHRLGAEPAEGEPDQEGERQDEDHRPRLRQAQRHGYVEGIALDGSREVARIRVDTPRGDIYVKKRDEPTK